ncbi:MAG: glycerol-3-phosphate 1-O-acyltransferase PlsY [Candidatus Limnocylindrales bacterium]|nr:glycerol-3-phosphate 1-O-acyltransferase PlsY [Candidatus Limnocylindrales bacterium]
MESGSVLAAVITAAAAYFIGGIPFGIVVARLVGGQDPRSIGSGRTGGANTLRAIGPRWALVSGLLDAAKGSVAVLLPRLLGFGPELEVLGALVAIVGHSRSPYIGFGGGRGVSVAWGTLVVIQPLVALAILPVFGGVILATRISSLGSLLGSLFGGLLMLALVALQGLPPVYDVYAAGSVALIWIFHLDNIARLLRGTERRIDRRP